DADKITASAHVSNLVESIERSAQRRENLRPPDSDPFEQSLVLNDLLDSKSGSARGCMARVSVTSQYGAVRCVDCIGNSTREDCLAQRYVTAGETLCDGRDISLDSFLFER